MFLDILNYMLQMLFHFRMKRIIPYQESPDQMVIYLLIRHAHLF